MNKKLICNIVIVILITLIIGELIINKVEPNRDEVEKISYIKDKTDNSDKYNRYRKFYNNEDIVGNIIIDNLNIDNLVVKGNDNKFYMSHDLYKKDDPYGSIFIDYRNDLKNSKKINIYGHNSHYRNVPFSRLKKYLDEEYFKENRYIYLETENDLRKYEIFSVYGVFKSDNEHMLMDFDTFEEWDKHFNNMKAKSLYDTSVKVNGDDNILTLQTCLYNSKHGKYQVINAKEISRN